MTDRWDNWTPELDSHVIYQESFSRIDREIGPHPFSSDQYRLVRRAIHATADFELGKSLIFRGDAIEAGVQALWNKAPVLTDVNMVQAGLNRSCIEFFGLTVLTAVDWPETLELARNDGVTRSMAGIRILARRFPKGAIVVIGNAPTALVEVIRLIRSGDFRPAVVIGLPVGMVSAWESKELLLQLDWPLITNRGRKGGSPAAAAIVNGLCLLAQSRQKVVPHD